MDAATAYAEYEAALVALRSARGAQSESIGDRALGHRRLDELRAEVSYWWRVYQQLTADAAGATMGVSTAGWSQ
jgi:hypothetical protein